MARDTNDNIKTSETMKLNNLVNGLIGMYVALTPSNAQTQTGDQVNAPMQAPTTYAATSSEYQTLQKAARVAFQSGEDSQYMVWTKEGIKEGLTYQAKFAVSPSSDLVVRIDDFDQNRTLSTGDEITIGVPNSISSDLKYDNPWYRVTNNGVEIHPANGITIEDVYSKMSMAIPGGREVLDQKRDAVILKVEDLIARATYDVSQGQIQKLGQHLHEA
ncbi:hypothetical protein HYW21_04785 [Candidatus Woesearchaeota archaeon]|nr:hypothetical protein [Candidatus Woesearchaeota archaeon]